MLHVNWLPARKVVCIALFSASIVLAQDTRRELPLLIGGKIPLYPIIARAARVEGTVKLRVTTDGEKGRSIETESGPPMLVKSLKEDILTWEFAKHKPTTFVATFEYVIEGPDQCSYRNGVVVLRLPQEAHISAPSIMTCDPNAVSGTR
jgi:hypothetical protein